jgi:hypothetical protein
LVSLGVTPVGGLGFLYTVQGAVAGSGVKFAYIFSVNTLKLFGCLFWVYLNCVDGKRL